MKKKKYSLKIILKTKHTKIYKSKKKKKNGHCKEKNRMSMIIFFFPLFSFSI